MAESICFQIYPGLVSNAMPLNLYKQVGETSLERIKRFQEKHPEYRDEKMSFAGRLDPLADGVLVVLSGEENKNREKFLGLDKEYTFEILFNIETDTYDILGMPRFIEGEINEEDVEKELLKLERKFKQHFPPFSSKHVEGKSMIEWAYTKRLDEIDMPEKEVEVYDISLIDFYTRTSDELKAYLHERISKVNDNFRPKQILSAWDTLLSEHSEHTWKVAKVQVSCGSGTYMRTIAHDIGYALHTAGCTHSITRTKAGEWNMEDSER